jgi:hypothetical protein
MKLVCVPVEGPSCKEDELSEAPIVLEPMLGILVQVFFISVQLFLRVNELQEFGLRPPTKPRFNILKERFSQQ